MAASAPRMAFLAAAFALALADEVRDVCDVREERDARDTLDTLSSGLTCSWKEFINLVVSIPVSQTSTFSCKCSTWSNTES